MDSPTTPATIGPGEFFPVVGVGPHPLPHPTEAHFDPELLLNGDRRNVLDKYRYWSVEAIPNAINYRLQLRIGSMISILVQLYEQQMHSMLQRCILLVSVIGISAVQWSLIDI